MTENSTTYSPTIFTRLRWRFRAVACRAVASWRRGCDRLKWLGYREGNLERHARRELELAGWFKKDGIYGDMMGRVVMAMIRQFAEEGHSGMSAPIAVGLFKKVSGFEPLTPLTGEPDEWLEVRDGVFQNRRCSHVFKDGGEAYDIEGRIFREASGACFTNRDSRVAVSFPYTPKREYVDVR